MIDERPHGQHRRSDSQPTIKASANAAVKARTGVLLIAAAR
jgi:hypothetical protein